MNNERDLHIALCKRDTGSYLVDIGDLAEQMRPVPSLFAEPPTAHNDILLN